MRVGCCCNIQENILLAPANGSHEDVSDELQVYKNDLDLVRLSTQLNVLPGLIHTQKMKLTSDVDQRTTYVQRHCKDMNEISMSKDMFPEVLHLIKISHIIPDTTSTCTHRTYTHHTYTRRSYTLLHRAETHVCALSILTLLVPEEEVV